MDDNSLTYPNAEILVSALEHKFWMDDGEMSRATNARVQTNFKNVRRVFNAEVLKRVKTCEWGREVIPGVTAQGTPTIRSHRLHMWRNTAPAIGRCQ